MDGIWEGFHEEAGVVIISAADCFNVGDWHFAGSEVQTIFWYPDCLPAGVFGR
jgi:hypothetical protein